MQQNSYIIQVVDKSQNLSKFKIKNTKFQ